MIIQRDWCLVMSDICVSSQAILCRAMSDACSDELPGDQRIRITLQAFVKDYLITFVRLLLGIDQAVGSGHLTCVSTPLYNSQLPAMW